ncbi:hypothetical protein [Membranihabitans maritimus]|uniref:hypothetical protein n=1 Tax=Membranihabitans maritimus TaxID=2904244 RepID=UPI001F416BA1|nr:hypothetical protein [Membranihabitans maritimus]
MGKRKNAVKNIKSPEKDAGSAPAGRKRYSTTPGTGPLTISKCHRFLAFSINYFYIHPLPWIIISHSLSSPSERNLLISN